MGSGRLIAILLAAAAGAILAAWAYGRLEEPVRGRVGPGVLRGLALFLVLAGWFLPALPMGRGGQGVTHALLLDRSLSMSLPAVPGGASRSDSATAFARTHRASFTLGFGDSVRVESTDGVLQPSGGHSRLVPALETARTAGADSVTLVTDGELDDRETAREAARRLGLAVREVRVADDSRRLAIRTVDAPVSVEAGDSIRLVVEVGAVGSSSGVDSVSLVVGSAGGTSTIIAFRPPDPGRSIRVPAMVAAPPARGDSDAWQALDVELAPEADPIGPSVRHRVWVEVVPTAAGAVIVSVDPDWEAHYLLPVLGRSVAGGARAWLRLGDNRWVRSGTDRMIGADDERVRRDAARAQLLVIQGPPRGLPGWLVPIAQRHPRVLFLARGSGTVPGSSIQIGPLQTGEWFAGGSPPPSPIAGFLQATDYPALPPASRLYSLTGFDWAPLEVRRNRTGQPMPPVGAQRIGTRRRAALAAEGMWRWASRAGPSRQAYRALFAGLAGWLLEAPDSRPVVLEEVRLRGGEAVRWRVAGGVRNLALALRDSTGVVIWSDTVAAPDSVVVGPAAPPGSLRYEARGTAAGEPFRTGRPLEVEGAERELRARPAGVPLEEASVGAGALPAGSDRPIWPFVLAALLLCAEWFWRRRIGLR
ncbi:MAG: hypothetical protein ACE5FP_05920 [Gemmatimonadota bacterium]